MKLSRIFKKSLQFHNGAKVLIFANVHPSIVVKNTTGKYPQVATRGVLSRKGVLKNFSNLTGKHLLQIFFFNTVAVLRLQLYE